MVICWQPGTLHPLSEITQGLFRLAAGHLGIGDALLANDLQGFRPGSVSLHQPGHGKFAFPVLQGDFRLQQPECIVVRAFGQRFLEIVVPGLGAVGVVRKNKRQVMQIAGPLL